jgi:mannose-6-phosphate isomerase-like protein (cupin superfamily)
LAANPWTIAKRVFVVIFLNAVNCASVGCRCSPQAQELLPCDAFGFLQYLEQACPRFDGTLRTSCSTIPEVRKSGQEAAMTEIETESARKELTQSYPGCRVKISDDGREMVAEISDKFAVAVIDRSQPHFHLKTRETYRILRGTLFVACAGLGHVLNEDETITIEPGSIHYARAADKPVWIEVTSTPPWSAEDHFVLG